MCRLTSFCAQSVEQDPMRIMFVFTYRNQKQTGKMYIIIFPQVPEKIREEWIGGGV